MTATGAFADRSRTIDRGALDGFHYLGNYVREIPSNLTRMMENAYDWEHLPFVHPSSFSAIELVEEGGWGWRARVELPASAGGGEQLIELLVDAPAHYWATTVVEGAGQGTQIHTQASRISDEAIEVDVRFYLPQRPPEDAQAQMILGYLQQQYARLYDEDEMLMTGRQEALDAERAQRGEDAERPHEVSLGPVSALDPARSHPVELATGKFVLRMHSGEWLVHAATCPHLLGPLADAQITDNGEIVCPWHGYRFPVGGGRETSGRPCKLPASARLEVRDGEAVLVAAHT